MKRKKLLIFGIFLSFFISCSDELERIPPTTGEVEFKDFGIRDARYYFEENATDLAPLRFTDRVAAKSSALPAVELIPEWDKAMESGHSGVRLVEVPLQSNTFSLYVESVIKSGKLLYQKRAFTRRRLVIARRSSGETDMFVITLVPSSDARGNVGKSLENFRYLGGGDFTGRVFCSTLEGEFVKAFGYTDGRLSGRLLVMKRTELARHAGEGQYDHYSTIRLAEGMKTRSGTYLFDEGGGAGSGYCPHGYPEGQCPHYGCNDEVVVVACPDCGAINGCFCPRCFYCGQKEKYCSCTRCVRCQRKSWECTCYQYPDPDPNPNPGGGGGGGGVTPGGGSSSSMGTLSKAIFNSASSLSSAQWKKVEDALASMNNDCMGGEMIGALKDKNITIVHEPNISANGLYNPKTNRMTIKDFKESEVTDQNLERTLFHELLHSLQTNNEDAKLNLEIEAHLAVYRYAVRKGISLAGDLYKNMSMLSDALDVKYNVTDADLYQYAYQMVIDDFKKVDFYKDFKESPSARNMNTNKNLAKDCEAKK